MGFKSFVKKLFKVGPFTMIFEKFNDMIDRKLNRFFQPLNSEIIQTRNLLNSEIIQAQDLLKNAVNLTHDATNLSRVHHKEIVDNQSDAIYHTWASFTYPKFAEIMAKLAGDAYSSILSYDYLLLMDISRNYMHKGNIWKLDSEIKKFAYPPVFSQKEKNAAQVKSSGKMKILFVSAMFPSIEHGGGLRLFDIITLLSAEHEVDLFTAYVPDSDKHSMELLCDNIGELKLIDGEIMQPQDISEWLTGLGRSHGYYDVIQCEYPHSVPWVETVRPFGRKIGFTFMECVTKSYFIKLKNSIADEDFKSMGNLARSFWEFANEEFDATRITDFQIATTSEDADFVESVSGVRPEIIPTCLSPTQVISPIEGCTGIEPEGNTVVFLGYFNHFPNVDGVKWYLSYVHQAVKKEFPDYRFLIVGAGDISQLQQLSIDDSSVVYSGYVENIIPYILGAKVCVLPLISGAGIRGKLNQYSLAGRASVSTTIGNLGLNYEDGESVLIADSPNDFSRAIIKLLEDKEFNEHVADQAKAFARDNFTWERHLEHLVSIYGR